MRILILGGTAWLGGYLTATALQQGHEVTCLARGNSGVVPNNASFIRADRDDPNSYGDVQRIDWDAVIDVSSQPGQVKSAARTFRDRTRTFIFISSCSVYADHASFGQNESAVLLPALQADTMENLQKFGEAKVACEQHVLSAFGPSRSFIIRPGLIGGPGDITHRTGYWPLRFARPSNKQGHVLIPDTPDLATQIIDVRDLAFWITDCAKNYRSGIYNAMGDMLSMQQHLDVARKEAGHTG